MVVVMFQLMQHLTVQIVILGLVLRLGNPCWKERELAQKALLELLPLSGPAVQCGVHHDDLEIAHRCKTVKGEYNQCLVDGIKAKLGGKLPWIDQYAYPSDFDTNAWTWKADKQFKLNGPDRSSPGWLNYRLATELYFVWLLDHGATEEEVLALAWKMAETEVKWAKKKQSEFHPPPEMFQFGKSSPGDE
jgi:hypothetical protein